jgi:phosphoribosylanthranilate isomerase
VSGAPAVRTKICGVTSVEQALACVALGADAIGVNLIAASPRHTSAETAKAIALAVGARALVVAVVADMTVDAMRALQESTRVGCLQLHGNEPPEVVSALLPHAYKAVRIGTEADVASADAMPGEYVLVDAKVEGLLGGTGARVDPALVTGLAKRRRVVLAGGLTPENVAQAVDVVRPYCVDVASGVERSPGVKDLARVEAFLAAVRGVTPT